MGKRRGYDEREGNPMRITFVMDGPIWRPYGAPKVIYQYANRLASRGHQIAVVHPTRIRNLLPPSSVAGWLKDRAREARNLAVAWGLLGHRRVRWFTIDPRVRMLFVPDLRASYVPDGDVVIASQESAAEEAAQYPDQKGCKFHMVQTYPGWGGSVERTNQTWRMPLHKILVAYWLFELGLSLGCDASEMTVVPNGVDLDQYRLINPIASRPKRVALLYSLREQKGSADGIAALEFAKKAHPSLQAVFFGTNHRRPSVPSWVEFRFDPPQEEIVQEIYNGSSILLFPSWREGFPLIPSEAMACGCAVVSTDCPGVQEFAQHEVNALLSPPRDIEALTKNLLRLLDDDALRIRLAQAGVETIKQFTWERSTDLLEALLKSKVQGKNLADAEAVSRR